MQVIHQTRSRLAVALAGVAALTVAACGTGAASRRADRSPTGVPEASGAEFSSSVSDAARRTLSLTANVTFRLDGARAFGAARAPVFGTGGFDFRSGTGEETIDLPEAAHQELGNEHAMIFPARAYLQPKGTTAAVLPRGKAWLSATLTGSESVSTNFPRFVGQVEGINPILALSELAGGTTAAQPVGVQIVDHATAERYRVSVDLTRALSALAGPARLAIGQAIQQQLTGLTAGGAANGVPLVRFYVWVDKPGRVVEYRAATPGIGDGTALVQMQSFGTRLRVRAPARSQVIGIGALTPSGERENNDGGDSDGA